jgi:diacylglycerol kinase (ATP)
VSEPTDIAMLINPRSGRGKGRETADAIRRALDDGRREITSLEIDALDELENIRADTHRALIVVGGDGTVHAALPALARLGLPVYHAPLGTENLFARQFGMSRDPQRVRRAVDTGETHTVDLASCDGRPFAIMCGLGFDADVIESLHNVRTGAISHLSYLRPILRELLRLRNVPLRVEVDGNTVVEEGTGQLVIANSRQYALRNDPALRASMTDGRTDVVFLPCESRIGLVTWAIRTRTRTHLLGNRAVYERGTDIRVTALGEGAAVQIDGEYARTLREGESIEITTHPGALNVLTSE